MRSDLPSEAAVSFGPFHLHPAARLLERGGTPVHIGGRALDILIFLAERAGEVVSKKDLVARVWSDVHVDEGSLRFHVTALRKALGDGKEGARYVTNVPGRGYCLVAPVSRSVQPVASEGGVRAPSQMRTLPTRLGRMVGRDDNVQTIADAVSAHRFVTIVGPGGIGKTTVATATGHALSPAFDGQVSFIDLGPLSDPRLVAGTVASSLGLTVNSDDPIAGLAASLRDAHLLLIFDSCEHVIELVAVLAEALFNAAPSVHILATSRESLRVEGEHIYRLVPLQCPPESKDLRATDVLAFPAAQLFVERVTAASHGFALSDADAPAVAGICHRLDGIPLALELAAAGVDTFGIKEVAAQLDRQLLLTTRGRRTAMPRHQTLRATIDWSYQLLTEPERSLLCRLGTFAAGFTLEAAVAVAEDEAIGTVPTLEILANLAAKSLVAFDGMEPPGRWRLLETIRAYALQQLALRGETQDARRRHAQYFRYLFASTPSANRPLSREDLAPLVREIDDVRAALDWSFAPSGDLAIGIELTAAFAQAWLHSSLVAECRERCERALPHCPIEQESHAAQRLQLLAGLGSAQLLTMGSAEQTVAVLTEALELAERLNQLDIQARLLWGLGTLLDRRGEWRAALGVAERLRSTAQQIGDPAIVAVADRLLGLKILSITGRLPDAQRSFERALRHSAPVDQRQTVWSPMENRAITRALLSLTLCLRGFAERAQSEARASLAELNSDIHQLSFCRVLSYGMCRVALLTGDLAGAAWAIPRLIGLATRSNAHIWQIEGRFLEARLMVERGDFEQGLAIANEVFGTARQVGWTYPEFGGVLAEALAGVGQFEEAIDAIDGALLASHRDNTQPWYLPELHRIKGETLLRQATERSISLATNCIGQAHKIAVGQGSILLELRAAVALARLHVAQDRPGDARNVLAPVYERWPEGFETPDLRAAKAVLAAL
jgi:predicted ATPase/DNA-binding winged helix-turn-helix (wHTH) protein